MAQEVPEGSVVFTDDIIVHMQAGGEVFTERYAGSPDGDEALYLTAGGWLCYDAGGEIERNSPASIVRIHSPEAAGECDFCKRWPASW